MLKECADKDLLSSSNSLIVQRMISKTRKQSVARLNKANEVKDEINNEVKLKQTLKDECPAISIPGCATTHTVVPAG